MVPGVRGLIDMPSQRPRAGGLRRTRAHPAVRSAVLAARGALGRRRLVAAAGLSAALLVPAAGPEPARAQDGLPGGVEDARGLTPLPSLNLSGTTGLVDMPSAEPQPEGELNATVSTFGGITRTTLSFQVLPRVSGSFRYTGRRDLNFAGFEDYYDRSFDLRVLLLRERAGALWPSITIGLQDFIGTGIDSAEYVVATKSLGRGVKVTAGLGWGRLGSYQDVGSPFGDRPPIDVGLGGGIDADVFFRGPVAPFGGIEWQATERLGLKLEYSSDAYDLEDRRQGAIDRASPINAGLEYRLNDFIRLGGYYMYGSELGASVQFALNPRRPPNAGSIAAAPPPVLRRPPPSEGAYAAAWAASPATVGTLREGVAEALDEEGLRLEAFAASPSAVEIRVVNRRYDASAQVIGRAARVLSRTMPPSVETFTIVPVRDGLALSAVTLRRSDLEDLVVEPDGTEALQALSRVSRPGRLPPGAIVPGTYPSYSWAIGPYTRFSYFDPSEPVRYEIGARASGRIDLAPGLIVQGAVTQPVASTIDDIDPDELGTSGLPRVRTDFPLYGRDSGPNLQSLTAAYYARLGGDVYGRVTAGYLERMFGGVSTELLWKPVESRLGLGVELNYARSRDYDQGFGFQDYDVVTGHASAYYQFDYGFAAQVDAGRYLAGDWGATFGLARTFANGWVVGGFVTLTDATAEEFGEGSFDKGLSLSIPVSWFTGRPDRSRVGTTIRPVTRDGGARLAVPGRLYGVLSPYHGAELDQTWGSVLR